MVGKGITFLVTWPAQTLTMSHIVLICHQKPVLIRNHHKHVGVMKQQPIHYTV